MAQHDIPRVPVVGIIVRSEAADRLALVAQPENVPASNKVRSPLVQQERNTGRFIVLQYTDPLLEDNTCSLIPRLA
ncbi:MAG: hypothetical protein U0223_04980 [Nitrospira sp.]|nr:hypothetical protein [Nitrospira sp.]